MSAFFEFIRHPFEIGSLRISILSVAVCLGLLLLLLLVVHMLKTALRTRILPPQRCTRGRSRLARRLHHRPDKLRSQVDVRIWEEFKRQGIEIPYPQRDLYIKEFPGRETPSACERHQNLKSS